MQTIKIEKDSVKLKTTLKELIVLNNSFKEVVTNLGWEFKIRTGFKVEEMKLIFDSIEEPIKTGAKETEIQFLNKEIVAFNQVLNEVTNGIKVDNFELKIGVTKQEAKELLSYISDLLNSIPR